jgi:hypothetical protein
MPGWGQARQRRRSVARKPPRQLGFGDRGLRVVPNRRLGRRLAVDASRAQLWMRVRARGEVPRRRRKPSARLWNEPRGDRTYPRRAHQCSRDDDRQRTADHDDRHWAAVHDDRRALHRQGALYQTGGSVVARCSSDVPRASHALRRPYRVRTRREERQRRDRRRHRFGKAQRGRSQQHDSEHSGCRSNREVERALLHPEVSTPVWRRERS